VIVGVEGEAAGHSGQGDAEGQGGGDGQACGVGHIGVGGIIIFGHLGGLGQDKGGQAG